MNKEELIRKVYITRKCRINAAERLKKTEKYIQAINIYYSIFMTVLAIYSVNNSSNMLSLILTIFSVIVTITIIYLASQKYGERAKGLKKNYIALSSLYERIKNIDLGQDLEKPIKEYNDLLDICENHTEYDYYKAMRVIKVDSKVGEQEDTFCFSSLTIAQKASYYFKYWGSFALKIVLVIIPLLIKYFATALTWIVQFVEVKLCNLMNVL